MTDAQPAIQLVVGMIHECAGSPVYRPKFKLENFGWGAAEQATLRFDLTNPASSDRQSSSSQSMNLGYIERTAEVNIELVLRSAGANVAFLSSKAKDGVTCRRPATIQACLLQLKANGTFGSLNDKVGLNENFVVVGATGRLEYTWRDAGGTTRQASSPFSATMPLRSFARTTSAAKGRDARQLPRSPSSSDSMHRITGCGFVPVRHSCRPHDPTDYADQGRQVLTAQIRGGVATFGWPGDQI